MQMSTNAGTGLGSPGIDMRVWRRKGLQSASMRRCTCQVWKLPSTERVRSVSSPCCIMSSMLPPRPHRLNTVSGSGHGQMHCALTYSCITPCSIASSVSPVKPETATWVEQKHGAHLLLPVSWGHVNPCRLDRTCFEICSHKQVNDESIVADSLE